MRLGLSPFADGDPRANKELDGNLEGEDAFAMSRSEIKNQGAKIVKKAIYINRAQRNKTGWSNGVIEDETPSNKRNF